MIDWPSKTTATPTDDRPGPHEPVTDTHRSSSNKNTLVGLRPDNTNYENEIKGAQAFDRISRIARGEGYRSCAPNKRLPSVRALPFPFIQSTGSAKRRLLDDNAISRTDTREENDIAEAIARSLQDAPACAPNPQTKSHRRLNDLDVMEIEATAFKPIRRPQKLANQARSYRNLGSNAASTTAAPHEPLHDLLKIMDTSVKTLDKYGLKNIKVGVQELADHINEWQSTIRKVIHACELSEQRRIKDLHAQLDFDQHVEEAHQNNINKLNQSWAETLHEQEKEWQKELNQLQQATGTRQQPNEPNESLAQLYATDMHPTQAVQRRC